MTHHIRFTCHTVTGETRATCTCGSSITGDKLDVAQWANYHLDRKGIDELKPLAPLDRGFVSGLEHPRKQV